MEIKNLKNKFRIFVNKVYKGVFIIITQNQIFNVNTLLQTFHYFTVPYLRYGFIIWGMRNGTEGLLFVTKTNS